MYKILVVIPARGGSKGIPRKNLRVLNGKPLLYYSIQTALSSKYNLDVYVSSEDNEILHTAEQFGAKIHRRDLKIADDKTTLDPVIYATYLYAKKLEKKEYDYIVTMQPTSPLLRTTSLDNAIEKIIKNRTVETVIAAKDDTHLSWRKEKEQFLPNYKERVNRQYLTPTFTETGAFFITRRDIISENNRIGKEVELYLLYGGEEIDIDTYEDWNLCEYYLKRKHIVFVVTGNNRVGLGHVYNTLLVANDILNHQITFLVDKDSMLAYEKIASKNYPVYIQQCDDILEDIQALTPDIVINDRLDTTHQYIQSLKQQNMRVINFEDLGEGALNADLVINAIYPEKQVLPRHYFGHEYFLLRDEFLYFNKTKEIKPDIKNILITFGGVDPNNYTKKVVDSIYDYCVNKGIVIKIVVGFGYDKYESLEKYKAITVAKNVTNISDYMYEADIIFTSAGRTTYEVASTTTPTIVLVQNERELTHFFASGEFGFLNLGLGYNIKNNELLQYFIKLVDSYESRKYMSGVMASVDLQSGRARVINLIQDLLKDL